MRTTNGCLSVGVGFGATNSAMAWYNADTERAEVILNAEGEAKTPSLVYFGEGKTWLVGRARSFSKTTTAQR